MPLVSFDNREKFLLNIRRNTIELRKGTYQLRARQVVVLARLDFGGAPHRNPDGQEVGNPHLHIYREGFGDKWAYPLPNKHFTTLNDPWDILEDFLNFINIVERPIFYSELSPWSKMSNH